MDLPMYFDYFNDVDTVFMIIICMCICFGGILMGLSVYAYDVDQDDSNLRLRGLLGGLCRRPDVVPLKFQMDGNMKSIMSTLQQKGMDHKAAPCLISRMEWYNQLNRYLDMLKNTAESIQEVADGLQVVLRYHHRNQAEVEEDLVKAIFSRVLLDGSLSHLYAKLFKRMRNGYQKELTKNLVFRLFQLSIDEFNSTLSEDEESDMLKESKRNNVKLIAAIFKREMSGVPDNWITDCANSLVQRLDADTNEQSIQELCLFLTTLLIAEPGENCDSILPSRQRQLVVCFDALERAVAPPKINVFPPTLEESSIENDENDVRSTVGGFDVCKEPDMERESDTESDSSCRCEICLDGYEADDDSECDTDESDAEPDHQVEKKTVKPTGLIEGILAWLKKNANFSEDVIVHQKTVPKENVDQNEVNKEELEHERVRQRAFDLEEFQRRAEMRQKLAAAAESRIKKNRHRYPFHQRRHSQP